MRCLPSSLRIAALMSWRARFQPPLRVNGANHRDRGTCGTLSTVQLLLCLSGAVSRQCSTLHILHIRGPDKANWEAALHTHTHSVRVRRSRYPQHLYRHHPQGFTTTTTTTTRVYTPSLYLYFDVIKILKSWGSSGQSVPSIVHCSRIYKVRYYCGPLCVFLINVKLNTTHSHTSSPCTRYGNRYQHQV